MRAGHVSWQFGCLGPPASLSFRVGRHRSNSTLLFVKHGMRIKVHFTGLEVFLRIGLLSGVALVGACRSSSPVATPEATSVTYPGLEWLTTADPIRDCTAAWERGDHRFIGVHGFAPYTPG